MNSDAKIKLSMAHKNEKFNNVKLLDFFIKKKLKENIKQCIIVYKLYNLRFLEKDKPGDLTEPNFPTLVKINTPLKHVSTVSL